jgi:2-haloacid dehalogenase
MLKPHITTIIFDFGGVLLDWDPHHLYRHYFKDKTEIDRFLSEIDFAQWNLEQDRGRSFAEGVAELSAAFPQHSRLIRAFRDNWEESIVGPIGGTVKILQRLKRAGYSLYGLSNWSSETFPIAYNKYDFFKLFDGIIISGEVKIVKPDPAIFELLLDKMGHPADECLLIDDSASNIAAAQKLGFATILFQSPAQLEVELQKQKSKMSPHMERTEK